MQFERRKDFAVRTELDINRDLELGELKWNEESVTLEIVNIFLQETPVRDEMVNLMKISTGFDTSVTEFLSLNIG